jgi:hypothetical protein
MGDFMFLSRRQPLCCSFLIALFAEGDASPSGAGKPSGLGQTPLKYLHASQFRRPERQFCVLRYRQKCDEVAAKGYEGFAMIAAEHALKVAASQLSQGGQSEARPPYRAHLTKAGTAQGRFAHPANP